VQKVSVWGGLNKLMISLSVKRLKVPSPVASDVRLAADAPSQRPSTCTRGPLGTKTGRNNSLSARPGFCWLFCLSLCSSENGRIGLVGEELAWKCCPPQDCRRSPEDIPSVALRAGYADCVREFGSAAQERCGIYSFLSRFAL